ncbi:hypothetical protein DFR30_0386 [Thiogranum longum]|uniref:Uncharacterized protein n=1 Tax=Thiogranum longum TaxID=1537524 RepID=A0A4R1HAH3_9GAMM|nr:hypothetical protein [Thiogranum longum]TCK17165.1 hypothetical protein DFR30_0386 [Thiogranum longum]
MNKRMLAVYAVLFMTLINVRPAFAACWQIDLRDGTRIKATDFWNLSSKLEDSPQSFLLGQIDGEDQQIPVSEIQSIVYQEAEAGGWGAWLKNSDTSAQIRFTDGRVSTLKTGLPVFYRTVGKKKRLPASTVMEERSDNRDMNLNIFYRARGDVKQVSVDAVSQIEHCDEASEVDSEADVIVQHVDNNESSLNPAVQDDSDVLGMTNGDMLTGRVTTTPIIWQTDYGVLEIKRSEIRVLGIEGESKQQGELELLSGDRMRGRLINKTLTIHLTIGQSLDVPVEQLRTLTLHKAATIK